MGVKMTENERIKLWAIEEVNKISSEMVIVRNIYSGQYMIKRFSEPSSIELMRRLCGIRHRNLMQIYDADIIGGLCVTLGEYVNGITLSDSVKQHGLFTEKQASSIIVSVCNGLKALHQNNIVHRDINPNNVMLDNTGCVKIIDYDISRTVKANQNHDTEIMGTPGYTAPEQFGFQQTNEKADIYSCGVLLNFLLTGKLPNEQMHQGSLTSVISRCIELDPNNRYENIDHLRAVLTNDRRYIKLMGRSEIESMRFRPLPGYRSKHFFPKLITTLAIITYLLCLSIFIFYIFSPEHHTKHSIQHIFALVYFAVLVFGFFTLFPYLLFGDVGKYSLKMAKDPLSRKRLNRLFGWLCIILGVILFFVMFKLNEIGIIAI
jgi:serine/threonine protein kinase